MKSYSHSFVTLCLQILDDFCTNESLQAPVYSLHTTSGHDQEGKQIVLYMYKVCALDLEKNHISIWHEIKTRIPFIRHFFIFFIILKVETITNIILTATSPQAQCRPVSVGGGGGG